MPTVMIKTDGSCLFNGMPNASGGWGCSIEGDITHELSGKLPGERQTNNRTEVFAILKALEWMKDHPEVKATIYSDSKIAIDGLTGKSKRNANRDIWEQVEKIVPEVRTQIAGVEHIKREENKKADMLAKRAAGALILEGGLL